MTKRLVAGMLAGAGAISLLAVGLVAAASPNAAPSNAAPSNAAPSRPAPATKPAYRTTSVVKPSAARMRLVFNATFTGTKLNTKVWQTCYPWAPKPANGCNNPNTKDYEWYLKSEVKVYGGALHLIAKPVRTSGTDKAGDPKIYACRSGMISSHPGFNFEYGKITVVARLPKGPGLWSALWTAASNLKWPPEADLVEHWGAPMSLTGVFYHGVGGPAANKRVHPKTANLTVGWHSYTLVWTSSRMTYYIDSHKVMTVTSHLPHQPMYFIANVAEYKPITANSGRCNGTMLIRSVKVWKS